MNLNVPMVCAVSLTLTGLWGLGCGDARSMKPETVTISKAEYARLQADEKLLSEYKAMAKQRENILKLGWNKTKPSLFDSCGNALGPDGKVYDPQDYSETSNSPKEQSQLKNDGQNQGSQPETAPPGDAQANILNGATQSFWLNVDSVLRFAHQKKCGEEYCDGFYLMAHDEKRRYGLMCVSHADGDSAGARQYNAGSIEQQHCQMVHTGKWRVTLSSEHMAFYSDPQTMAALYRVTSEQ